MAIIISNLPLVQFVWLIRFSSLWYYGNTLPQFNDVNQCKLITIQIWGSEVESRAHRSGVAAGRNVFLPGGPRTESMSFSVSRFSDLLCLSICETSMTGPVLPTLSLRLKHSYLPLQFKGCVTSLSPPGWTRTALC